MSEIQYAVLNFGYVESYRLGSLVLFNNGEPFTSEQEALKSLAEDLLAMYKEDTGFNKPRRACCRKHQDCKFCPECGLLIKEEQVYADDFQNWLVHLMERDLDSVGSLEDDVTERDIVWELGYPARELIGAKPDTVLVIKERAENVICEVLGIEE